MVWQKSYIYAGDSLLSTFTNNGAGGETLEFQHPDRLGTKLVTNPAANSSFEQATLPFGTSLDAETSGTTNQRFTSYDRSTVTGIDYAVNRSYSPAQGRFTQPDPIGMSASSLMNPQSLNLYAYCGNDPINHTDPTGLFWGALGRFFSKAWKVIKTVVAVVAAIVAVAVAIYVTAGAAGIAFASGFAATTASIGAGTGIIGAITSIAGAAVSIYNGVGAIRDNFAQTDDKSKKKKKYVPSIQERRERRQRIFNAAYRNALWRLKKKPDCAKYIQGGGSEDPAAALQRIHVKYGGAGNTGPNGRIIPDTADTAGAGEGGDATIFFDDIFFDPTGELGGWTGTMNVANTRALVVLHELRHAVSGKLHPIYKNLDGTVDIARTENDPESDKNWYRNIAKKCFGVNAP